MKAMRILAMLMVMAFTVNAVGQKMTKEVKSSLKSKATKTARKEAKKLTKEGWTVSPGALPLDKQLDRSYAYALDENETYIIGQGQSVGENYDAARLQATELARLEIAGNISSEATSLIDNMVGNKQMGNEEAATMTTLLAESKTIFSQKLGEVKVVLETYRTLSNKNKEVLIRLAVKKSDIQEIAKNAIREEMEKRGIKMNERLQDSK